MEDFRFIAGDVSLDFLNTVGNRLTDPREHLVTGADVDRWARQAGLLMPHASLRLGRRDVMRIRSVRECMYGIVHSLATGRTPPAAEVARFDTTRRRTSRKHHMVLRGNRLTWAWISGRRDPDRLLGPILEQVAELVVAVPPERLRQCEDAACGWLFLDRSRAGVRRWCSMDDCGNRAKAHRHYHRDAGAP